jgi:hypothetical protein
MSAVMDAASRSSDDQLRSLAIALGIKPKHLAIAAAWRPMWLFRITSALQMAGIRDFTPSKKFLAWRTASVPRVGRLGGDGGRVVGAAGPTGRGPPYADHGTGSG